MRTPWGTADAVETVIPGVVFASTPSHGGYGITRAIADMLPVPIRNQGERYGGKWWYEEDCAYALFLIAYEPARDKSRLSYALGGEWVSEDMRKASRTPESYHAHLIAFASYWYPEVLLECGIELDQEAYNRRLDQEAAKERCPACMHLTAFCVCERVE